MRTMEQHLDDLGREVAQARRSYDAENKEAETIQALSQQRMSAAEHLQNQVEAETDPIRKAALEKSLETLVSLLETMAPEVEREKTEAFDAKNFLEMLEQTYAEAGGKFKSARSALDQAQRDMGRAAQQREQADRQAEIRPPRRGPCEFDQQPDGGAESHAGCGIERFGLGGRPNEQSAAASPHDA